MRDDPTRTVISLSGVGAASIPALTGTKIATRILQNGRRITVDAEAGVVLIA